MNDRVAITIDNGVADVRLTRADKMNALDPAMFDALEAAGRTLATEPGVRAVVLSGAGKAFCAGLDMASFSEMANGPSALSDTLHERTHGAANQAQHISLLWRDLPMPVIAAVHGVAFGGGFQVMLGADIRIVAPDARLAVMEVKWGLIPDMAGFALMRGLVREDVARELTYTGRQFAGHEAVRLGLATKVAEDPHAEAMAMARQIAGSNPHAVRASKRLFNLGASTEKQAMLLLEALEQQKLIGSANQVEAVNANLERRPARFTD